MATYSSILAWRIPWMEEVGGLQSTGRKESDTTERLYFHFTHFDVTWDQSCLLSQMSLVAPALGTKSIVRIIKLKLLLLLLSHFSCVQLCVTPQMAAHQAPQSLGFPGKNIGVGCHFLLQCMKVRSESEVAQLCPTLSNPMDCSPPSSSIHGIFQARVLEWDAIAFSET